jgi:hypothetical protein
VSVCPNAMLPNMHPTTIVHVKIFIFMLQWIPKATGPQAFTSSLVRNSFCGRDAVNVRFRMQTALLLRRFRNGSYANASQILIRPFVMSSEVETSLATLCDFLLLRRLRDRSDANASQVFIRLQ